MKVRELPIGGRRCVRVGTYMMEGEPRVFVSTGWQGVGALPFAAETADLPASALPALIAVLEELAGGT